MSDTDDNDDESTVCSKLHLDPQAVISLAKSITNCSRVIPPAHDGCRRNARGGGDAGKSPGSPIALGIGSGTSYFSGVETSSYFSTFSRRLQETFSNEDAEREHQQGQQRGNDDDGAEILSFLVSDVESIERLAAITADGTGVHASTSELEGAGVARIDVYCRSGTVITCRVIPTASDPAYAGDDDDDDVHPNGMLTPRKDNVSETTDSAEKKRGDDDDNGANNNTREGTQVRRIVRRQCTLDALRRILLQPPELPEINEAILRYDVPPSDDDEGDDDDDGADHTDTDTSQASTVSKALRRRKQRRRRSEKTTKFSKLSRVNSKLSKEQRKFLRAQQKKYESRVRRDEESRLHLGNAILAAGMGGCGSEMGMDLVAAAHGGSADCDSMTPTDNSMTATEAMTQSETTGGMIGTVGTGNEGGPPASTRGAASETDAHRAQMALRERIEIADMGLAILMGEAQRLERISASMREGKGGKPHRGNGDVDDDDDDGEEDSTVGSRSDGRYSGGHCSDGGGSFSTIPYDTDGSRTDALDSDDSSSSDGDEDSEEEERRLARLMQGCEIEYSFPHPFHDDLEGALMNEDVAYDDDDDSSDTSGDDDDTEDESRASSRVVRRRRGRSPPKDGAAPSTNAAASPARQTRVSPVVAVPTSGEGCVVLRENGAFDVVGKISPMLRKKLFRSKGPMPDRIALGTLGRYYVHFVDGSFFFYGPPALRKILNKGNKQNQRRGKRGEISVVSVAFGKKLDDFFVVRSDGSWETNGTLPSGLEGLMKHRRDRADLLWVALGPQNEWCVRSKNGRVWWEGVSDEADEALADILAEDGENELKFIDFGKDDTYFLLHK